MKAILVANPKGGAGKSTLLRIMAGIDKDFEGQAVLSPGYTVGYLEQGRTDYGEKEVASFREQVRTVLVPLCQKLYDAQAKRLGIDHVMWHDEKMVFPDGNAEPAGDAGFMVETARKMYHEISHETGEFIDFMIDHQLMDLENKPGKAGSLAVYHALAARHGRIDAAAAQEGLELFAEHTADAPMAV
jgi:energy-coupling factor transporter ATP-binding protein EcfA2